MFVLKLSSCCFKNSFKLSRGKQNESNQKVKEKKVLVNLKAQANQKVPAKRRRKKKKITIGKKVALITKMKKDRKRRRKERATCASSPLLFRRFCTST